MSDYKSTQNSIQSWRNVEVLDDNIPLPPPSQSQPQAQPVSNDDTSNASLIMANGCVTMLLIVGMVVNGEEVRTALITGASYFSATTIAYLLIRSGTLSAIISHIIWGRVEKHRINAVAQLGMMEIQRRREVEANRHLELATQLNASDLKRQMEQLRIELVDGRGSARGLPVPASFVPAAAPSVVTEALEWASTLYNELGEPNRRALHPDGRLKNIRMLGSKRGLRSRDAGQWLIDRRVIKKVDGGFALDLNSYPTREHLRTLR